MGVLLFNHSDTDFHVEKGDRVAQLICERIFHPTLKEIQVIGLDILYFMIFPFSQTFCFQNLTETVRGSGGFGSSGVN